MNRLDFIAKPPNFYEWLKARVNRGGSPSPVPSDYDLLEYLESDGTAFIKLPWNIDGGNTATGLRNLNDGFKIKFALSGDQQAPFGDRYGYFLKSENGYMWARVMNDSSANVLNTNIPFTTSPQEWEYNNDKKRRDSEYEQYLLFILERAVRVLNTFSAGTVEALPILIITVQ